MSEAMSARIVALVIAVALATGGCRFLSGYAEGHTRAMVPYEQAESRGFYRLVFDDFNSLNTDTLDRHAVPYKMLVASVLLARRKYDPSIELTEEAFFELARRRYGFARPDRIGNWPRGTPQPPLEGPLGLVTGVVSRSLPKIEIEVANTGCSTCHAATLYDARGMPTRDAWIGLPSSSINLERYAQEVFDALGVAVRDEQALWSTMRAVFPDLSRAEAKSLDKYVIPELADRLPRLERRFGGFQPYSNGSTGLTNGVATIKRYLGIIDDSRYRDDEIAYAAIPGFGGLHLKTSILYDGVYAPNHWPHEGPVRDLPADERARALGAISALVTIGTLGVTPKVAVDNIPRVREVIAYLFEGYEPPAFPGAIDGALADRGAALFEARCQGCHGRHAPGPDGRWRLASFPNRLVPADVIETDPARWRAVTPEVSQVLSDTAIGKHIDIRGAEGYIATPLTGVWATAPYLHNGSVPTIWHLLNPDERPERFFVGGHALDYDRLGIAGDVDDAGVYRYPDDYEPWTIPDLYDTREPGRSRAGHAAQVVGLTEGEKRALIEFLKRL